MAGGTLGEWMSEPVAWVRFVGHLGIGPGLREAAPGESIYGGVRRFTDTLAGASNAQKGPKAPTARISAGTVEAMRAAGMKIEL